MLIVEGTGHAGVGACFGLSNARVAELLGAKVIIVASGGIGKPLDEIALNMALFREHDVEIAGVILNKVLPEKHDKVSETVRQGLKNLGTRLLGAVPYDRSLKHFTMGQLVEHFKYKVFSGRKFLSSRIDNTVVAAMEPEHAVHYIRKDTLVIVAGDRERSILAAAKALGEFESNSGGIILTGGLEVSSRVSDVLKDSRVPVLVSEADTFTVSSGMSDLEFKIRSFDSDKIDRLYELADQYVDTEAILEILSE